MSDIVIIINVFCRRRQGSGSACRSVYGGFVEWQQGEMDGTQSKAVQVHLSSRGCGCHDDNGVVVATIRALIITHA